jgi:hypothetical protein
LERLAPALLGLPNGTSASSEKIKLRTFKMQQNHINPIMVDGLNSRKQKESNCFMAFIMRREGTIVEDFIMIQRWVSWRNNRRF